MKNFRTAKLSHTLQIVLIKDREEGYTRRVFVVFVFISTWAYECTVTFPLYSSSIHLIPTPLPLFKAFPSLPPASDDGLNLLPPNLISLSVGDQINKKYGRIVQTDSPLVAFSYGSSFRYHFLCMYMYQYLVPCTYKIIVSDDDNISRPACNVSL